MAKKLDRKLLRRLMETNRQRRISPRDVKMDLTPMIDVVFLLIVFFMLVTEMSRIELEDLMLPFASKARKDEYQPGRIVVNVKADRANPERHGAIWVNHRRYDGQAFRALLHGRRIRSRQPDDPSALSVKIRADANVEWKHVQAILVACMRERIWQCSFGTLPKERLNF